MVPPAGTPHQSFAQELLVFLRSRLRDGLRMFYETGDGTTHAPLFGLDFETIDGPKLRITAADASVEI